MKSKKKKKVLRQVDYKIYFKPTHSLLLEKMRGNARFNLIRSKKEKLFFYYANIFKIFFIFIMLLVMDGGGSAPLKPALWLSQIILFYPTCTLFAG